MCESRVGGPKNIHKRWSWIAHSSTYLGKRLYLTSFFGLFWISLFLSFFFLPFFSLFLYNFFRFCDIIPHKSLLPIDDWPSNNRFHSNLTSKSDSAGQVLFCAPGIWSKSEKIINFHWFYVFFVVVVVVVVVLIAARRRVLGLNVWQLMFAHRKTNEK